MTIIENPTENQLNEKVKAWFETFVHNLRADELMLATNVASPEKQALYETLANGNSTDIHMMSRVQSATYFIGELIKTYFNELKSRKAHPSKLGVALSEAKILVWAEIKDDDEPTENKLRLAEARVNAEFMKYGFHLTSTIVETSDNLLVPSHYQSVVA